MGQQRLYAAGYRDSTQMIASLLGGIGLFLLGMVLLTDGLKAAAGDALRSMLSRFAGGPFSSFLSGAGVTALVQSSSATTLTTIGFVSAGLLTFPQAVGVIFGANVGTTSTGWIVSLLGLKVTMSAVALPLIGVGALTRLLLAGRARAAAAGIALAGFGLIFVGIDVLQAGMSDLSEHVDPSRVNATTFLGRVLLVLVGVAMTVVMQSSSAAVAATLAALHAGTIQLDHAAVLVIGQNIGTTVTAGVAVIGASVAARQTALAHILFNAVTAVLALALLPLFMLLTREIAEDAGATTAVAAFHTAFNLLGVVVLLPLIARFSALVQRLVPERGSPLTRNLDPTVASVPAVAVEAARLTVLGIAATLGEAIVTMLRQPTEVRSARQAVEDTDEALDRTRRFLASVRSAPSAAGQYERHVGVLHAIDHLERLVEAARESQQVRLIHSRSILSEFAASAVGALEASLPWLGDSARPSPVSLARAASVNIAEMRRDARPNVMSSTAAGDIEPDAALHELDAMRWVDRIGYHWWRALHHLAGSPPDGSDADAGTSILGPSPPP